MEIFGFETSKVSDKLPAFEAFGEPRNRKRDWVMLFGLAFTILIVMSIYSLWTFYQVQAGSFSKADEITQPNKKSVTIDREKLNQAVSDYKKQEATFDLLRNNRPDVPNPS